MANIQKRTYPSGKTGYRVQVRLHGYPTQTATFERLTDAKRWAQQTEAAIREGRHFKTAEAKKHTLGDAITRYRAEVIPHKGAYGRRQAITLEWWDKALGPLALADVTPAILSEAKGKLLAKPSQRGGSVGPATVNRYLAALSHVLSLAADEWGWMDSNPILKVSKPREPRGRVRFLSDAERDRLLDACRAHGNPYLHAAVLLALTTGMRSGEVMGLRWADVDFERQRLILHYTKNGERRSVPLVGPAFQVLADFGRVRRLDTDLLFPSKVDPSKPMDLRAPWETVLKRAEIADFRFHDLRHSAASYLAMSGASLGEIAEVLGHKTLQMVKRYAHLTEGHTASVVERMTDKFLK